MKFVKGKFFVFFSMNQQFRTILQTPETRRRPFCCEHGSFITAGSLTWHRGDRELQHQPARQERVVVQCDIIRSTRRSVKGKLFGIVFNEPVIYTDITHEGDEKETFAGVGGWF